MKKYSILLFSTALLLFSSCGKSKNDFDASGTFEAEETIISAEGSGVLKQFNVDEGSSLTAGQLVGYVDTIQLSLKKRQLEAQINALLSKRPDIQKQLASLKEQLAVAVKEQNRIASLVKVDAATAKQLDDINGQVEVIRKQIEAQESTLSITADGINKDAAPLSVQTAQLNDQIEKCKVVNPINGTVLSKYAEENEMTAAGKPLYKIADLTQINLRAYITANQLPLIKLNQSVRVMTDDGKGGYKETKGTVSWINDKAEFTPKTIQTKDERVNTVYAIKVRVVNDGTYKIGMYGEIKFQ